MEIKTLYVKYEGFKPFIQCTVTDEDGHVRWKGVDSSVGNHLRELKKLFKGYNLQARLPGVRVDF